MGGVCVYGGGEGGYLVIYYKVFFEEFWGFFRGISLEVIEGNLFYFFLLFYFGFVVVVFFAFIGCFG